VAVEAGLANLHQCESTLEANQATTTNSEVEQIPTFDRASSNMAVVATLLVTLPMPSTDGVGKVYQQLKNIFGTTTT
jgi:hypothetical protein